MKKIKDIYIIPLKYGGFAAVLSIILFLVLYYFGKNPLLIPPILDFRIILFPIILVFGIRDFKENRNSGHLHFWQGMSLGIQIIFIVSFLMAVFILLFGWLIEQDFVAAYIGQLTAQIQAVSEGVAESIGQEALDKTLELIPSTTILDLSSDYFIKSLPYGLFLTIIISLILRKKPTFEDNGKNRTF